LEDYVRLAEVVRGLHNIQVVWVFGPDDLGAKDKISALISDLDIMYQPPTVMDYCYLIRDSELLISTSTGPMHLAGALNIKTVSFFGSGLFASSKRWATVNDGDKQLNIEVDMHYQQDFLRKIIDLIIQKINL
jgi:ADP-heptose:LPS heptosyltransferase